MKKMVFIAFAILPLVVFAQKRCSSEAFSGHDRKQAKISLSTAHTEIFDSLPVFYETLPLDEYMRGYSPPISRNPDSQRVEEEDRNVTLGTVYIFAVYREADNDYHIIIGSSSDTSKAILFNIEVSGLPDSSSTSFNVLKRVRDKITSHFGKICSRKMILTGNPVKVSVTGSLFYDIDHKPGVVGPGKLKPKTAWEIHPVSDIIFK